MASWPSGVHSSNSTNFSGKPCLKDTCLIVFDFTLVHSVGNEVLDNKHSTTYVTTGSYFQFSFYIFTGFLSASEPNVEIQKKIPRNCACLLLRMQLKVFKH